MMGESSLFIPDPSVNWWPKELGAPSATGSQNNVRYAYFANQSRLAVETNGEIWVYDTQDHQIGGFSQQQGMGGSILFTSQYGTVALSGLPVVSINGVPQQAAPQPTSQPASTQPAAPANNAPAGDLDPYAALERLGALREKGILTEDEFAQKKQQLLDRL
jgi:hypothetical protein